MAPRFLPRVLQRPARGAWIGLFLGLAWSGVASGCTVAPHLATQMPESLSAPWLGQGGVIAWYDGPTTRYPHGVLGDTVEATRLHVYSGTVTSTCNEHSVTLPAELVFEDLTPRLSDLDGDGAPEIIVVQSHQRLGAQLAIYRIAEEAPRIDLIATTPFIGRSNRWLAPIGAADLDGDGHMEIAYIDRPHLARTLRVWRYTEGTLTEIASLEGLTNHRIGEDFISGGIRDCGSGPEMITANTDWSRLMATRLIDGTLSARDLGSFSTTALRDVLSCSR